jgi:hypothetical protein
VSRTARQKQVSHTLNAFEKRDHKKKFVAEVSRKNWVPNWTPPQGEPSTTANEKDSLLLSLLLPTIDQLMTATEPLARYVNGRVTGSPRADKGELRRTCESAAFLAFVALGGDVESPSTFDFTLNAHALFDAAKEDVKQTFSGKGSTYSDLSNRWRHRVPGAQNTELKWSAWESAGRGEDDTHIMHTEMIDTSDDPFLPKCVSADWTAGSLIEAITEAVGAEDARLMVRHYIEGVEVETIAREVLAAQGNSKPAPDVLRTARYTLYQRLCRIRQRCAKRMGDAWAMRAGEVS